MEQRIVGKNQKVGTFVLWMSNHLNCIHVPHHMNQEFKFFYSDGTNWKEAPNYAEVMHGE